MDPSAPTVPSEDRLRIQRSITTTSCGVVLGALMATAMVVALCERLFGFPPLVMFAAPIALAAILGGFGLLPISVIAAALIADYLFVEPVHHVTVYAQGQRLLVFFALSATVASIAVRRLSRE